MPVSYVLKLLLRMRSPFSCRFNVGHRLLLYFIKMDSVSDVVAICFVFVPCFFLKDGPEIKPSYTKKTPSPLHQTHPESKSNHLIAYTHEQINPQKNRL